eukprot:CAMPEP_0204119050 /NCGR_PEP_ID=MMETSP0361-20130328/6889_1 /ASSEMBLY_ACC=CAM_ASM_000343 /TAXON_ID=268821 /ORGANISM="Scrippsiella Hangoei, Strain SHTV-5" /LENGTH=214 /DNA_ID=CAMNT_0051070145 /DNA_START=91 /DNA_END=735 /DNA_ORIENTATION=+
MTLGTDMLRNPSDFGPYDNFRKQFQKTQQCRFYPKCTKGDACRFAHSDAEFRRGPIFTKSKLCAGWKDGRCKLAPQDCRFAHGPSDLHSAYLPQSASALDGSNRHNGRGSDLQHFGRKEYTTPSEGPTAAPSSLECENDSNVNGDLEPVVIELPSIIQPNETHGSAELVLLWWHDFAKEIASGDHAHVPSSEESPCSDDVVRALTQAKPDCYED